MFYCYDYRETGLKNDLKILRSYRNLQNIEVEYVVLIKVALKLGLSLSHGDCSVKMTIIISRITSWASCGSGVFTRELRIES